MSSGLALGQSRPNVAAPRLARESRIIVAPLTKFAGALLTHSQRPSSVSSPPPLLYAARVPPEIAIPEGPGGLVFKHFWVALGVVTAINFGVAWQRSVRPRIERRPDLADGYRSLFWGMLLWTNVPWVLMGVGALRGDVPFVHEYFFPSKGDPAVLFWWAAMGVLALGGTAWLFAGGAEKLEEHPGLPSVPIVRAKKLKALWLSMLALQALVVGLLFAGFPFARLPFGEFPFGAKGRGTLGALPDVLVHVLGFALVACLGVVILVMLGQTSGWSKLAEKYSVAAPDDGPSIFTTGRVGLVNYGNILRVGADARALHLSLPKRFTVGHRPLSIPWGDIQVFAEKNFLSQWVRFELEDGTTVRVVSGGMRRLAEKRQLPKEVEAVMREL